MKMINCIVIITGAVMFCFNIQSTELPQKIASAIGVVAIVLSAVDLITG